MKELWDKVVGFVKKNPWTVVTLVLALAMLIPTFGCQIKGDSPFSGKKATEEQILAEQAAHADAKAAEQAALAAAYEQAVRGLETDFQTAQTALAAEYQKHIDAKATEFNASAAQISAEVQTKATLTQSVVADIRRQKSLWAEATDAVAAFVAPLAGPYAPVLLTALGLVTAGLGIDNRRKAAENQTTTNAAMSLASSIEAAKKAGGGLLNFTPAPVTVTTPTATLTVPPAGDVLDSIQTREAKALVDAAQGKAV